MKDSFDIAVLGAGPAGANAAMAAAEIGLCVALVDEQPHPGGQVWRNKSPAILDAPATPESLLGDHLRETVARSQVTKIMPTRVWAIERHDDLWSLRHLREGRVETLTACCLIIAAGAREVVQPLPGWTLPGVIGLAGATALLKQHLDVPGRNTVVSGTGPLVFLVASEIRRLGGRVAAVVTPNSRGDWLRALPRMTARSDLLFRGVRWMADLALSGTPVFWRHTISAVQGQESVEGVRISPLDRNWAQMGSTIDLAADSLCLGHGLEPDVEAARLAGLGITLRPDLGGWVPKTRDDASTGIEGVFLCGDCAGIRGAAAAVNHGTIAGLSAALRLGRTGLEPARAIAMRRHARAARFGIAMTRLSMPRCGQLDWTTSQTVLCRCESLTRAAYEAEVLTGARSTVATKSGTRTGMGPCGGRYCQTVAARIVAARSGLAESDVPPPTARPPLRPVPIAAMSEGFSYDELPIPKPAPL